MTTAVKGPRLKNVDWQLEAELRWKMPENACLMHTCYTRSVIRTTVKRQTFLHHCINATTSASYRPGSADKGLLCNLCAVFLLYLLSGLLLVTVAFASQRLASSC